MVFLRKVAAFSEVTLPDEFLTSDAAVVELLKFAETRVNGVKGRSKRKTAVSHNKHATVFRIVAWVITHFVLLLINQYHEHMYLSVFCMQLG